MMTAIANFANSELLKVANGQATNSQNVVTTSGKARSFTFTTLDILLSEPEESVSFVWENLLPVGGFSICSAKPKVGKSTLARNLAVAITRGESFLGRETVQGKILYLVLEEKRSEIAKHFRAMSATGSNILIYTGTTPENALESLQIAIAEYNPVLVVIDPLARVLRTKDFNDYGSMARDLEPFIDTARKFGTHILALHHDGKGFADGGDAILGSTALFGAVDCHIQLKKRAHGRTVSTTNRYGLDLPETVIELNQETGTIVASGDLDSFILRDIQNNILKSIGNDELAENLIKERLDNQPRGLVSKAIRELINDNKLTRTGNGRKGDPFVYKIVGLWENVGSNNESPTFPQFSKSNPDKDCVLVERSSIQNCGNTYSYLPTIPTFPQFSEMLDSFNEFELKNFRISLEEQISILMIEGNLSHADASAKAEQLLFSKWLESNALLDNSNESSTSSH